MNIDLCHRSIARLCFDATETSEEEATVAGAVEVLQAAHNKIQCVQGLKSVFVNLVELRLAHNQLGHTSTPYYRVRHACLHDAATAAQCCDGVASWILALPATLQVLDVSFNYLHSFLECKCVCTALINDAHTAPSTSTSILGDTSKTTPGDHLVRVLRHHCPLALPLFFSADRLPQLRELNISHNSLAVSLRESDEMQSAFEAAFADSGNSAPFVTLLSSLDMVDLSYNRGVASLNCFFLCAAGALKKQAERSVALSSPISTRSSRTTLKMMDTGLADLRGIASVNMYGSGAQWHLWLHPSPVSETILFAPPPTMLQLLHTIVGTRAGEQDAVAMELSAADDAAEAAIERLQSVAQLGDLEAIISMSIAQDEMAKDVVRPNGATWVSTLAYACLLHQVVPSLEQVDELWSAATCERLLLDSLTRLLLPSSTLRPQKMPTARLLPTGAPPLHPNTPTVAASGLQRGLAGAAHCVDPELRTRVVMASTASARDAQKDGDSRHEIGDVDPLLSSAPPPVRPGQFQAALAALRPSRSSSAAPPTSCSSFCQSTITASSMAGGDGGPGKGVRDLSAASIDVEDWFTPSALSGPNEELYESLCAEAKQLQEAVLASNARSRETRTHIESLQQQLTQDRARVMDCRKEISRFREEREQLEANVARQRQRLEKREKEVTYGVATIRLQEAAVEEKAALERLAAREKDLARRERQLRRQAARVANLKVEYHGNGPSGQPRKLRSELLREAAIRKRLAEQESKDPFAYSPTPFKADHRRVSPPVSPDCREAYGHGTEEERAYFRLYSDLDAPSLREAAEQYVAHLPPAQQRQLREASAHSPSSGGLAKSPSHNRETSPTRQRSSSGSGERFVKHTAGNITGSPPPAPNTVRDLSALSLSELLDAAAAIRQKQLALQDLQRQWKNSRSPSAPSAQYPMKSNEQHGQRESAASSHRSSNVSRSDVASAASTSAEDIPAAAHASSTRSPFSSAKVPKASGPNDAQQLFDAVLELRASAATMVSSSCSAVRSGTTAGDRDVFPADGDTFSAPVSPPGAADKVENRTRNAVRGRCQGGGASNDVLPHQPQISRALFS